VITQLKTLAKDGYEAAQIGLVEFVKNKNVTKPQAGHFAKTEAPPVKVIKEVALSWTPRALKDQGRRPRAGRHLLRARGLWT
jgi:large subunit ribosomal protein L3